jgi:hypothetical protein
MKTFPLVLILVRSIACACFAADKPVAGKPYTLLYDPSRSGILSDANQIWVVYAFDYWGAKIVQKLRREKGESDLFQKELAQCRCSHILISRRSSQRHCGLP